MHTIPVLTIDGPSGVGKGTASRNVAAQLDWHLLDSGAIYRALALAASHRNIDLDDADKLSTLAQALDLRFAIDPQQSDIRVMLNEQDVSEAVRSEQCGHHASQVAALPAVRSALLKRQQAFRCAPGLVADGRDMGSIVFPDADCKIFLTASVEERADRRYKQLKHKGINVRLPLLLNEMKARDERDSRRAASPLKAADDAIIIDTSELDIDAVTRLILKHLADIHPEIHLE